MFGFGKRNVVTLPYTVEMDIDSIIIEASGEYNEAFIVFRGIIKSEDYDLQRIYIKLNENIVKEISLSIEYRDFHNFEFDFSSVLTEEEIKSIKVVDESAIIGGKA